jgi:hypothetical protein
MKQVDAKREILAEWRAQPKEQRQTEQDAVRFANTVMNKYKFRGETGDPYQTVKAWILRDMLLRRSL